TLTTPLRPSLPSGSKKLCTVGCGLTMPRIHSPPSVRSAIRASCSSRSHSDSMRSITAWSPCTRGADRLMPAALPGWPRSRARSRALRKRAGPPRRRGPARRTPRRRCRRRCRDRRGGGCSASARSRCSPGSAPAAYRTPCPVRCCPRSRRRTMPASWSRLVWPWPHAGRFDVEGGSSTGERKVESPDAPFRSRPRCPAAAAARWRRGLATGRRRLVHRGTRGRRAARAAHARTGVRAAAEARGRGAGACRVRGRGGGARGPLPAGAAAALAPARAGAGAVRARAAAAGAGRGAAGGDAQPRGREVGRGRPGAARRPGAGAVQAPLPRLLDRAARGSRGPGAGGSLERAGRAAPDRGCARPRRRLPEPARGVRLGSRGRGLAAARRTPAAGPGRARRRPRRGVGLSRRPGARALPERPRDRPLRGRCERAGARARQPRGLGRECPDGIPLARRRRRPARALRRDRHQPALPWCRARGASRSRARLHRRGRGGAAAGRTAVAGGQPTPAVRGRARRRLRQRARGRRARRLQGGGSGARAVSGPVKLVKLLANLGYGSRKEVARMFREGRVTDAAGEVLYADDQVAHADVRVDGEPLDPAPGLLLMLHKPVGYTCSTRDPGRIVYDLLPSRFRLRKPLLSTVGRLDRDTSGLLLMTDDGALLHRIVSPKSGLSKTYEATL